MPDNPWLSIDTTTLPAERARELRQAWERFVGDGDLEAVRMPIAHSWQRSHAAGVDPSASRVAPVVAERRGASARWDVHPLRGRRAVDREVPGRGPGAEESEHLIVVSDAWDSALGRGGQGRRTRLDAADAMDFTEGALGSERTAGTNAVGTALAVDHAVQVFAAEHFNEVVQQWTCAAAPVHDPDTDGAARRHRPDRPDRHRAPAYGSRARSRPRRRSRRTCASRWSSATAG